MNGNPTFPEDKMPRLTLINPEVSSLKASNRYLSLIIANMQADILRTKNPNYLNQQHHANQTL